MKRIVVLATFVLIASCATAPRDRAGRLDAILAMHPAQSIAVARYDLQTGESLLRNEHERFHAASTMKLPVMLAVFEAVTRGELSLDQKVVVKNDFVSIVDGSHYALESGEDSEKALYDLVGTEVTLEDLVRRMIVRSSNLATNHVIQFVGAPNVMKLMKSIGANEIEVLRGVEDDKAYHAGLNNTTTANDLMLILKALAEERVVSPAASKQMIDILLAQEFNDGIPAGVVPGARVAHKTGSITAISHDAGIVFNPDGSRYVLVVLTRGFKDGDEATRVIAAVSRAVAQD
jgi:beta-lactamase class A